MPALLLAAVIVLPAVVIVLVALLPAAVIVLLPMGADDCAGMSVLLQPAAISVSEITHARVHCSYAFNNILALSLEVRSRKPTRGLLSYPVVSYNPLPRT